MYSRMKKVTGSLNRVYYACFTAAVQNGYETFPFMFRIGNKNVTSFLYGSIT